MKRVGYLYDQTFSLDSLYRAYQQASRGKHTARACFEFERRLAYNLDCLYAELASGQYRPKPYHRFVVREPKERVIYAPAFRDLVVQHAIYRTILPIFDPGFVDTSFACRIGYGTHCAADYTQRALKASSRNSYTLKVDVKKFFYSINRAILRSLIERKIKDVRFVDIMMQFADYGEPKGIPIGNLLSQVYALVYLNPVDQFIKRILKVKLYCRYVDDLVLFNLTRQQCIEHREAIRKFMQDVLDLEFSRTTVAAVSRGVNFVGYRTWSTRRFVRKHSLYKLRRCVRQGKLDSVMSILGHARQTHSLKYMVSEIRCNNDILYRLLPQIYQTQIQNEE